MTPTYRKNLISLRDCKTWLDSLQVDDPNHEETRLLTTIFTGYANELRCRLGITNPYRDELDRRAQIMYAVRCIDPIFDGFAECAEELDDAPLVIRSLIEYLGAIATDCTWTIIGIEARYPERKEAFAVERKIYAAR